MIVAHENADKTNHSAKINEIKLIAQAFVAILLYSSVYLDRDPVQH